MKTTAIYTNSKGKTLVKLEKGNRIEWVVCSEYNDQGEEGARWCWGHYFDSFEEATQYMNQKTIFLLVTNQIFDEYEQSYYGMTNRKDIWIFSTKERAMDAAEEYIQGIYPEEEWEEMYKALEKRPYRYEKSTNEEFKDESNTEYIEIVEVELNTVNNSFNPVRV